MFVYKNKHLSFFCFFQSLHWGFARPAGACVRAVESVATARTSTQNTSMQKVKTNPYRYNFKLLASKMRFSWGWGTKKKKIRNQSTFITEHTNLLRVFLTLLFFFCLFDLIFLSLNIQKSALAYIN